MAASLKKTESVGISLSNPIKIKYVEFSIVGDTPLCMHKWSEKAKKEMLDKQMKVAKQGKEAKDPMRDYWESIYHINEGQEKEIGHKEGNRYGFPAVAFKLCAVDACSQVDGMTKVLARQSFHVMADEGDLVEIFGVPEMREDMVRVGMGTADIRFRGYFPQWSAKVKIKYNPSVISIEQMVNLFNLAGFGVGVGEWRPTKDGQFGTFHVE